MGWTPEDLCRRADIIDTQHRYAFGIDRRDWSLYRSVFADRVRFDFTSWHGGEAEEIPADQWVERVAARQSGFDATQHQMSNHQVSLFASTAECVTYVVARHYLRVEDEHRVQSIGGYYRNGLRWIGDRWKIERCTLTMLWTEGDRALFDLAAARLKQRTTGDLPG
jgi:hypothetical protein